MTTPSVVIGMQAQMRKLLKTYTLSFVILLALEEVEDICQNDNSFAAQPNNTTSVLILHRVPL